MSISRTFASRPRLPPRLPRRLKQPLSGDVSRESLRAELAELRETMMR